jgi:ubiquinone/menaquinone biosynthesis C-methylase UbiE
MTSSARYFDDLAPGYDQEFGESSVWAIAHRTGRRLLAEHLGGIPATVLDAGCGTGKWGLPFARAGARVTFTDVAQNMVDAAVTAAGEYGTRAAGQCLPVEAMPRFADGSFALTLCMGDPLSYSADPHTGIAELVRVTEPGGTVFVSVDSRMGYLRVFKERDGYDLDKLAAFHRTGDIVGWEGLPLHAFTAAELRERFAAVGARCVGVWALPTVSAYFLFDPPFQAALRDPGFRERLTELEWEARDTGGAPGSHHLYGLFVKDAR